jgi:hypothetical protein
MGLLFLFCFVGALALFVIVLWISAKDDLD